jgi:hypothetical protein
MSLTLQQLQELMDAKEDERLEFSGMMVLGVTDKRPRRVVGSQARLTW